VAEAACEELAPTLKGLSRERVAMELLSILELPDPHATLARMQAKGVLPVILPEAGEGGLARLAEMIAQERTQDVEPSPIRRLAAMLPAERKTAEQVAARLRLSNAQRKQLARLAERSSFPEGPRALAYREGPDMARDQLLLAGLPIDPIEGWHIPAFPLKGGAIVARGVDAGPEVARVLQSVETRWIAEGFPDAARVEQLLGECLSG